MASRKRVWEEKRTLGNAGTEEGTSREGEGDCVGVSPSWGWGGRGQVRSRGQIRGCRVIVTTK